MGRLMRAPSRLRSAPKRIASPPKVTLPFYKTAEWKALVTDIKAERGSCCEADGCGRRGFVIADHIVEIRDGGATLDKRNIRLLCAPCHGRKTEAARRARVGRA